MTAATHRLRLQTPRPFCLRLALFGHGWVDLPPHRWNGDERTLTTASWLRDRAVDLVLRHRGTTLTVHATAAKPLDAGRRRELRGMVRRMLRLDEDLAPFWELCRRTPRLSWVAERGAGRLMRSPTLFEDLLKMLFTTNCSWAATRAMTRRLVDAMGPPAPSGRRAFPTPGHLGSGDEAFFRGTVRAGYRARACVELVAAARSGALERLERPGLTGEELRTALLGLPGFGPYAAGQTLRLLGHYRDLALDSWCRAQLARRARSGRAPADRTVSRRYARFGSWAGLALWMDLTSHWHRSDRVAPAAGDGRPDVTPR